MSFFPYVKICNRKSQFYYSLFVNIYSAYCTKSYAFYVCEAQNYYLIGYALSICCNEYKLTMKNA